MADKQIVLEVIMHVVCTMYCLMWSDVLAETRNICVVMVFMHAQMFFIVVKLCVLASGCTKVFTGSGDCE